MLKDMKLSTILLLAVVGFLVYCLMKPAKEGFADEKAEQHNQESHAETESETASEAGSEAESESDSEDKVKPVSALAELSRVGAEAEVSPEMVNQILADSEGRMRAPSTVVPEADSYGYEANDEDVGVGASLDSAFEKPVPEGVKTDVVDLNRNNVKNYNAKDYLPKEVNDDWFNTDFSQAKYKMNDDKLINTERYVVGINTVGQSLKNASYDIRGAINVPKYSVSPWNNSTTEPDYNIKPLC